MSDQRSNKTGKLKWLKYINDFLLFIKALV